MIASFIFAAIIAGVFVFLHELAIAPDEPDMTSELIEEDGL